MELANARARCGASSAMDAQAAGDRRAASLRLLHARFARQAGLIAAGVAIVISLPFALAENAYAMTAAAGGGAFVAVWPFWHLAFRGGARSLARAAAVGVAGTIGAYVSMWSILAMVAALDYGELAAATGVLAMGAIGLLVVGPFLLPLGAVAGVLVRRYQLAALRRVGSPEA